MTKRKTLTLTALACAAIGFAINGCTYDDSYADAPSEVSAPITQGDAAQVGMSDEPASNQVIALSQPATESTAWLTVESPAFAHAQAIPSRFTGYGSSEMPELKWSNVPANAQSFAVIVEDPDTAPPRPYVNLVLYNIPANQRSISGKDVSWKQTGSIDNVTVGRNSAGTVGYIAPAPPIGSPQHMYHFQVFALDTPLHLVAGADKQELLNAINGHVLAKGETIGTYQR